MLRKQLGIFATIIIIGLTGCTGGNKASLLDDISGVWKAKGEEGLMTIRYADKKIQMLFDDTFIPVTIGDIDEQNRTVNFNVKLNTGKQAVWTIRQIWENTNKASFHLGLTLHDGKQLEFSFVRKVGTDDLNRIANLEPKPEPVAAAASVQQAAPRPPAAPAASAPTVPAPEQASPQAQAPTPTAAPPVPPPATIGTFTPSFDCAKASTGPERLICSNQNLSALDVRLMQKYKQLSNISSDKASLRNEQNDWRIKQRDACSTADCINTAYLSRIDELESEIQHLAPR